MVILDLIKEIRHSLFEAQLDFLLCLLHVGHGVGLSDVLHRFFHSLLESFPSNGKFHSSLQGDVEPREPLAGVGDTLRPHSFKVLHDVLEVLLRLFVCDFLCVFFREWLFGIFNVLVRWPEVALALFVAFKGVDPQHLLVSVVALRFNLGKR